MDDLALKSDKQALVALYQIPESKKITKDCLVGVFVQADTHALWRVHQTGPALAQYDALITKPEPTAYYAVYTQHTSVGTIGGAIDLDVSDLE